MHLQGLLLPAPLSPWQATADQGFCRRPSNTHRQVYFSLLWDRCFFPLNLVHTWFYLFPPRLSVSPVLQKFSNQILLSFKGRFPGDFQSLFQIPRWGNMMWSLEPPTVRELLCYNCSSVCGSPIQQLYGRANGDLLQENLCHTLCLPGLLLPVPHPCVRPLLTHTSTGDPQTLTGRSVTIGSLYLQVCFILLFIFYFRDSTCK